MRRQTKKLNIRLPNKIFIDFEKGEKSKSNQRKMTKNDT